MGFIFRWVIPSFLYVVSFGYMAYGVSIMHNEPARGILMVAAGLLSVMFLIGSKE